MSRAEYRFDNNKRRRSDDHPRQRMLTPSYILEPLRKLLGQIELDPCTEESNPTNALRFYCPPDDGCSLPWDADTVFCNPPYGEARARWVDKCIKESGSSRIALLIPAHTDTKVFQRAMASCTTALLIKGRLRFGVARKNGIEEAASHGSALFGFGLDLSPLCKLGLVVTTTQELKLEIRRTQEIILMLTAERHEGGYYKRGLQMAQDYFADIEGRFKHAITT